MTTLETMGEKAKAAARQLGACSGADRNRALEAMADALMERLAEQIGRAHV